MDRSVYSDRKPKPIMYGYSKPSCSNYSIKTDEYERRRKQQLSLLAQIRTLGGSLIVVMLISFAASILHSDKDWKNAFVMTGWISGSFGSVLSIGAVTRATLIQEENDL